MPLVELDPNELRMTAERLERRISQRFPGSGLAQRAVDLQDLLDRLRARADEVAEPIAWVRALYLVLAVVVIIGLTAVPIDLSATEELTTVGWVQFVEALVNDIVLLGAGIAFLTTLETRIKRRRALRELHEIRSFAHVIDMMQLTKDPQHLVDAPELRTEASPTDDLDAYELLTLGLVDAAVAPSEWLDDARQRFGFEGPSGVGGTVFVTAPQAHGVLATAEGFLELAPRG